MNCELSDKHLEDYDFYMSPATIPNGWIVTSLQDVNYVITDGTHKTPNYVDSGVRFISIKNIKPFQPINWAAYEKYITPQEHAELIKRCRPEYDDILFPRIGTLGYAKRIDFHDEVSIFVGLGLVKPIRECVLPKYVEYYLNTPYVAKLSEDRANGSGRMTLPLEESRQFPFPLPPHREQRRIVAKIEELFSELDKGLEALTTARQLLKAYRHSVLKHAFEGKLTEDWRANYQNNETGSDLRLRVLRLRRNQWNEAEKARFEQEGAPPKSDSWKARYPQPEAFESEDLPELPAQWCWAGLDELVSGKPRSMQSGPFGSNLRHSEFRASGVLVIGIDNVRDGTFSMGSEHRISEQKFQELEKYQARPGDLLVTVMASLGRTCVVPRDLEKAIITKHVYRISMDETVLYPEFFNLLLQSPTISRRHMFKSAQGQTRPGLNSSILKTLPIPLCSKSEQIEIVSRLSSQLSGVDHAISETEDQLARTTALRQSILKQAFSGKLVAQDPKDEPASVLLERIRAKRNDVPATKSRNGRNGQKSKNGTNGKKNAT
jgi:type I restriction enzyme S subunit